MNQYMLIIKGLDQEPPSPSEIQRRIEAYRQWTEKLGDTVVRGQRLEPQGVLVKDANTIQTDGPFAEAKEIIAGYVMIWAKDLEAAVEITKSIPLLEFSDVLVREIVNADIES